jgi:hypothetical protein
MRFRDIYHAANLTEIIGFLTDFIGDKSTEVTQYQQITDHA